MRVLFDTNSLLDIGLAREPFAGTSFACFVAVWEAGESPCKLPPHSLATFFNIIAQACGTDFAKTAIMDLIAVTEIVPFGHETAQRSLNLHFDDFADAMVAAAAEASEIDFIVTRNGDDFKKSPVAAPSPEAFQEKIG